MTPSSTETGNFILSLYHTILHRDRITYKCPLNESNTIECTVEQKAIISGEYILTQFVEEGSLNYIQLSDPVYLKFDFYPFVKETQIALQEIKGFNTELVFYVTEEISNENCPILYYDITDITKTLTECNVLSGKAYYPVNSIPNGEYLIYVKTPCKESVQSSDDLTSTEVTLKVNVENTVTISGLKFFDDNICTKENNLGIKIQTDSLSTGYINNVIIKNNNDNSLYTYKTCSYIGKEITCSNLSSSLKGGEYSIYAINGNDIYDFSSFDLVLKVNRLGPQIIAQQYYKENDIPSFEIILASEGVEKPTIYSDENGTNEISCVKEGNKLKCTPTSGSMGDNQKIYYRDICSDISDSGITIKTLTAESIVHYVTKIATDEAGNKACNDAGGNFNIYIMFSATAPSIDTVTLRNKDNGEEVIFNSCSPKEGNDTIVQCSYSSGTKEDGLYALSSITPTEENYFDLISMTSNEITFAIFQGFSYYPNQPIVNKFNPYYFYILKSEKDAASITIRSYGWQTLNCTSYKQFVMCYTKTAGKLGFPRCGTQYNLAMNPSETPDSAQIFHVLSVTNENNESYCVEDAENTNLIVTIDGTTSYTADNPSKFYCAFKGINGYSRIDFDDTAQSIENYIKCPITETPVVTEYLLYQCESPFSVLPHAIHRMKVVSKDPIISNEQTSSQKIYNIEDSFFNIRLANENIEAPTISISKDKTEYTEIKCEKIGDILQCTPKEGQMEKEIEYEVFYLNRCDKPTSSNIKVTYYEQNELFGQQRITEYYVNKNHNKFKVLLNSDTVPSLYLDIDNQMTEINECEKEDKFLTCTLSETLLDSIPIAQHSIYYQNIREHISQSNFKLNRLDDSVTIYTINKMILSSEDDILCKTDEFKDITLEISPDISTLSSLTATLTLISSENVEKSFNTCEIVTGESKIKCSSQVSLPIGSYTLLKLSGIPYIDLFDVSFKELKHEEVITPYDSNQGPISIIINTLFNFYGNTDTLKLYSSKDSSNEIQLFKANTGYGSYFAIPRDFPKSGQYSFHYMDKCGRLQDTGVKGNVQYEVNIQSIYLTYLTQEKKCSSSPFTTFEMIVSRIPTVEGIVAVLTRGSNNYNFNCGYDAKLLTCTSETEINDEGTYTLNSVQAADLFTTTNLNANQLFLEFTPFAPAEQQNSSQTISPVNNEIIIKLKSPTVTAPTTLYVTANGEEKTIPCQKASDSADEVNLKCTPNYNDYETEGPHMIYSKNSCSDQMNSEVSFTKIVKKLAVTSFVISGTNKCQVSPFSSFTIDFNDTLQGSISGVKIKKDEEEEKTILCTGVAGDSSITCSISEVTEGEYVLTGIVGDDNFEIPADTAISYETDPLEGTQQENEQKVNDNKTKFSIKLKSESTKKPTFTIGASGAELSQCVKLTEEGKTNIVECEPSDTEMSQTNDYNIYYISACGEVKDTGIIIHHIKNIDIQVTDFKIVDGTTDTCTTSPTFSFIISLNAETTGPISEVKIKTGSTEVSCTCGEEENLSSYTCTPKSEVPEGEFSLVSVTGDDRFTIQSGLSKIQYEKQYLLPAEEQTATQKIDKNAKTFTLKLATGITKDPTIYVKDSTTAIPCTRNPSGSSTLECTPDDTLMPETAKYQIEYMGACATKKLTGVTVDHVLTSTIAVGKLYLGKPDETCDLNPITSFTFTIGTAPKGPIDYAELTLQSDNSVHKFTSCTSNNEALTVTCTGYDGIIPDGDYKLTNVEGVDTYVLSSAISIKLTYDIDPLLPGSNLTASIDKNTKSFFVNWNFTDAPKPKIMVDTSKPALKCSKYDENVLECIPTDEDMPETKNYTLKYTGACYLYRDLGITVWHQLTTDITVSNLSLDSDKSTMCSASPFTSFTFSIDKAPNGAISEATLTKDDEEGTTIKFKKCEAVDKVVTCSEPENKISGGNYTLTQVEGVDTYLLNDVTVSIQYDDYKGPFGEQLEEQQETNGDVDHFILILDSEEITTIPNVKVKVGEEYKDIRCEQDEETKLHLNCFPDLNNMPETDLYEIYYIGACKEPISIGISIKNVLTIEITVTDVFLSESGKCLPEMFSTFYFVTDKKPTASLQYAILTKSDDGVEYKFNSCTAGVKEETNEQDEINVIYYVKCTLLEEEIEIVPGNYILTEVKGKDTYTISLVEQGTILEYQTNPLTEQTLLEQRVNPDTPSFYITLVSETTTQPKVLIIEEENNIEITCEKNQTDLTQLICIPDQLTELTETKDYEIFYEAECRVLKSTNITVKNVLPITIEVSDVVLADNFICRTDSISEVKFTIDLESTGSVSYTELTDSEGNLHKLENCVSEHNTLVCTTETPIDIENVYKVTEIKGVDTYIIDSIADKELQLITSKQYLGEQPNEEYTVDKDINTFNIVLFSAETEAPTIYAGQDETLVIDCVKNAEILVCTPNENNMPESKVYEIYYKDGCGNIASTGVIVNNVLPEEGGGEINIQTKGEYLTMWKLFIGGLLVLLF